MRTPQRVAAYLRLSEASKLSIGESLTIDDQRQICNQYTERNGWASPVAEYVDDDLSAAMSSKKPRPGFERLMADLESGKIDGIVCRDLDRLYRSPMEQARVTTSATMLKVPLLVDSSIIEVWTPSGYLQNHMLGGLGHFENLQKSKRQKAQAAGAAKRGKLYLRQRPFGWTDSYMTQHDEREAEAIRMGVNMLGELGKYTLRDVADTWNSLGVHTPRSNKPWIASNVRTTLMRPAIAGIVTYHGEEIDVKPDFDPIVTREQYDRMVASLKINFTNGAAKGIVPGKSPIRGVAKCGRCNGNMTRRNKSYSCAGYPNRCRGVYILVPTLENFIFDYTAGRVALLGPIAYRMDSSLATLRVWTSELEQIASERAEIVAAGVSMSAKLVLMEDLDKKQSILDSKLTTLRSESAIVELVTGLKSLGKRMSFDAHTENKKMIREKMRKMSPTQLATLCGTFGIHTVHPGTNTKERIKIEELDPFGDYFDYHALEA